MPFYIHSKKIALAVKRRSESTSRDELKPKRISTEETSNFSWDEHCFICGEEENLKKNKPLLKVNIRLSKVHQKVLNAELERKDDPVVQRLIIVKLFREQLEEGSVVLLPEMCKQYRKTLVLE